MQIYVGITDYNWFDEDYRIDVSRRLHEDYGNGRDYYKYHGQKLLVLPEKTIDLPSKEYLRCQNENVFLTQYNNTFAIIMSFTKEPHK